MQIYESGHLPQPTSDDYLCTCLAGSSRALDRVRIWHVRIMDCLTFMQRYKCSVCHLIAKDCLNNVAANIRFISISCKGTMTSYMYEFKQVTIKNIFEYLNVNS